MEKSLSKVKSEILIFLLATFGITFSMGILMFFIYKRIDSTAVSSFAVVQMLYPALTAIILKIYYEKNEIHDSLMNFFKLYIVFCSLSILILIVGVFIFPKHVSNALEVLTYLFSIITFILIAINKDNCFEKISMVLDKNFKGVLLWCSIFLVINYASTIAMGLANYDSAEISKMLKGILSNLPKLLIIIPISIPLSFLCFFGEELGWRGFLQSRLQMLYGKKLGVIILGFIWGIWRIHLSKIQTAFESVNRYLLKLRFEIEGTHKNNKRLSYGSYYYIAAISDFHFRFYIIPFDKNLLHKQPMSLPLLHLRNLLLQTSVLLLFHIPAHSKILKYRVFHFLQ